MQITMLPVDARHPVLERLVQLCLYDLSAMHKLDIDPQGCFTHGDYEAFLDESVQYPFLVEYQQRPVGFVLIGQRSRIHEPFHGYCPAGIFVLRRYRRQGIARTAALHVIDRFPGAWELATDSANLPGIAFWRHVADRYTRGAYHEAWHQHGTWSGTIQAFVAPAASSS